MISRKGGKQMPKKSENFVVKAKWKIDSPIIYKTNAFRSVYTPDSIVLYLGLIDPEVMLPEVRKMDKIAEIKTLARYCLDKGDLIRLKNEIDKTISGLKKMGVVFKDVK
jgi:hypothetical protein